MLAPIAQGAERIFDLMRYLLAFLLVISSLSLSAFGQTGDLRQSFVGKQITLRIDVPAKDSVNIYPEHARSLDYSEYAERLKSSALTIKRGEVVTISDLRVEHHKIEVEIVDQQNHSSGFSIRFQRVESWMLTPATVIDALNRYVEFTGSDKSSAQLKSSTSTAAGYVRNGVVHIGPRTTYLKAGLTTEEVTKLLGQPSLTSTTDNGARLVYEFERGQGRVLIAEFVGDSLVSSRMETRPSGSIALVSSTSQEITKP